jgi:hypothetical protein
MGGLGGKIPIKFDTADMLRKTASVSKTPKGECPILSRIMLRLAAESDATGEIQTFKTLAMMPGILRHDMTGAPRVMPAGVCELFASRLAQTAGVNVPEVTPSLEPPSSFDGFVKCIDGVFIKSRAIADGLPIYFLRDRVPTAPRWLRQSGDFDRRMRRFMVFEGLLVKPCTIERAAYSFRAEDESNPKLLAIARWNSPERLLIAAYRSLLHTSFCHASNTLLDTDAKVWAIDHEKTFHIESTDDIQELYELLKASEPVTRICRQVSQITGRNIRAALAKIPTVFWKSGGGVLDNPTDAAHYFSARVAKWRSLFQ